MTIDQHHVAHPLRASFAAILICSAGFLAAGLISSRPCRAAEIPAWLDDAISTWNEKHADTPMQFVSIKDSYVWYTMPKTAEIGHKQIREAVKSLVLANNYVPLREDESVTTGRPPVASGKPREKKCWTRSYQKGTKPGSVGQVNSMLTTYVCDDAEAWWAGFRTAQ